MEAKTFRNCRQLREWLRARWSSSHLRRPGSYKQPLCARHGHAGETGRSPRHRYWQSGETSRRAAKNVRGRQQAYEGVLGEYRDKLGNAAEENADTKLRLADSTNKLHDAEALRARAQADKDAQPQEPKTEPELALAYQIAVSKNDTAGKAKYKGALDLLA